MVRRKRKLVADRSINNIVNMSPAVDLLFTLLFVFMIPNQILFGNIPVEIPRGQTDVVLVEKEPITVYVKNDGTVFLETEELKLNQLGDRALELTMRDLKSKIFVVGDKQNTYGRIISVVDILNNAGFQDVVLVTDLSNDLDKK